MEDLVLPEGLTLRPPDPDLPPDSNQQDNALATTNKQVQVGLQE